MYRMVLLIIFTSLVSLLHAQVTAPRKTHQVQIQGNHAYTADEILEGLRYSIEFAAACEPVHSDMDFLRTAQQLVQTAYQRKGFLKCTVKTSLIDAPADPFRYRVEIDEGPQTTLGELEIDAPKDLQGFLKASWNEYCKALPKPIWTPGEAWNPDPEVRTGVKQHVDQWLRAIGYQPWTAQLTFPETGPYTVGLKFTFNAAAIKPKLTAIDISQSEAMLKKYYAEFEIQEGMEFTKGLDRRFAEQVYLLGMFQQVQVDLDPGVGMGEVALRVKTVRLKEVDHPDKIRWSRDLKRVWHAALAPDCENRPSRMHGTRHPFVVDVYFNDHDAVVEVTSNEKVIARIAHDAEKYRLLLKVNEEQGAFTVNRLLLQLSLERDPNNFNGLRINTNFHFGDNHHERPQSRFFITFDGWEVLFPIDQVKRTEEPDRIVWDSPLAQLITTPANDPIELTVRGQDRAITCYWDQEIPESALQFLQADNVPDILVQRPSNARRFFVRSPTLEQKWSYLTWMFCRDVELYSIESDADEFLKCFAMADYTDHAATASCITRFLNAKPRGTLTTVFALAALQKCQAPELVKKYGAMFQQRIASENGGTAKADWDLWFEKGSRPHAFAECFDPVEIHSIVQQQSEFMLPDDPIQGFVKLLDTGGLHGADGWALFVERIWKPVILPRFQIKPPK